MPTHSRTWGRLPEKWLPSCRRPHGSPDMDGEDAYASRTSAQRAAVQSTVLASTGCRCVSRGRCLQGSSLAASQRGLGACGNHRTAASGEGLGGAHGWCDRVWRRPSFWSRVLMNRCIEGPMGFEPTAPGLRDRTGPCRPRCQDVMPAPVSDPRTATFARPDRFRSGPCRNVWRQMLRRPAYDWAVAILSCAKAKTALASADRLVCSRIYGPPVRVS